MDVRNLGNITDYIWLLHIITSIKRLLSLSFHRREKEHDQSPNSAFRPTDIHRFKHNDPINYNKPTSNFQILPAFWLNVHWLHTSSHTAEALLLLSLLRIPFVEFTLAQQTTCLVSIIPAHLACTEGSNSLPILPLHWWLVRVYFSMLQLTYTARH